MAIGMLVILCVFPLLLGLYICCASKLQVDKFLARYGELHKELRLGGVSLHKKAVLMSPLIFVVKRLIFALSCVLLTDKISLQVQLFSFTTILSTIYLVVIKP